MTNNIDANVLNSLGLGARPSDARADRLGQEDFMRLMITQLTHQDPFSPMENGEFLGQLAQFGTVSGIADMQKEIRGLVASLAGTQTLQAASLVNRDVLLPARDAWLPPEGAMRGAVEAPGGARNLSLEIMDLSGTLIARMPLEAPVDGRSAFVWDGALPNGEVAPPGFYELRAVGEVSGQPISLEVLVSGRVESVGVGGSEGSVALTVTGFGTVDLSRVRSIS